MLGLLLVIGIISISLALPFQEKENEENIKYAPRSFFNWERGMDFRPVFFWGDGQNLHYLGLKPGRGSGLEYLKLDQNLQKIQEAEIDLLSEMQVEFLFPVGMYGEEAVFGLVSREEGSNQPYLVFQGGEITFSPLGKNISRNHDIAATVHGGEIFITYIERAEQEYRLWFEKKGKEPFLVFKSENLLCLPRFVIGPDNTLHMQWKGSENDRGIALYQAVDLESMGLKNQEPKKIGFASYYFGRHNGQPIYYREDPGADFFVNDAGEIYITWTDSIWDPGFNIIQSTVKLARIGQNGDLEALWRIQGRNFPLFGNLFSNEKGELGIVWEDYFGRQFNLMYTYLDSERDILLEPQRITDEYSSNRLARVINNHKGDFVMMARRVDGSNDRIWGLTSSKLGSAKWYHNWQLWFVEEGFGSIVIEGSLMVLYSFIASLGLIARNGLSIFFIGLILYILQKNRLLGKINCFQFLGILIILIFLFREYIPLFYTVPPADNGLMLFSGVVATATVLWVSRKNWFKGGEEFLYLFYSLVWIFSDTFLLYLALAPQSFMP